MVLVLFWIQQIVDTEPCKHQGTHIKDFASCTQQMIEGYRDQVRL